MKAKFLVTVLFVAFLFIKLSLSQVVGYDEAVMIATKSFSELHSKSTAQVTLSDNYYAKLRKSVGEAGRKTIEKLYSIDANKDLYIKAFHSCVNY
ncbi:MAG: hypothetical protein RBR64_08050 [Bacteroidales bacterium]|jgi:hypothetical protein|nr:hypothetical protein [Bacteroidales bacterium]